MGKNNAKTIEDLRNMIREKSSGTSVAELKFDHGQVHGWLGALYWADLIDRSVMTELRAEAKAAFEQAGISLNGAELNEVEEAQLKA
jgi:hypothetical protein